MKQYEIWWAEMAKPAGRRPVLLLSRDDACAVLNKFVAAEIIGTIRHIPLKYPRNSGRTVETVRGELRQSAHHFEDTVNREDFENAGNARARGKTRC